MKTNYYSQAQIEILKIKAKSEPSLAAKEALQFGGFSSVFEIIVNENLEEAKKIALATDNQDGYRDHALGKIVKILAPNTPLDALPYALEIKKKHHRCMALRKIFEGAYKLKIPVVLDPSKNMESNENFIANEFLCEAARIQAFDDVATAKQMIQRIENPKEQQRALVLVLQGMAVNNPLKALQEARLLSEETFSNILRVVANQHPKEVLEIVRMENPILDNDTLGEIFRILLEEEYPHLAMQVVFSMKNDEQRNENLLELLEHIEDEKIALEIVQEMSKQPGEHHANALSILANLYVKNLENS